MAQCSTHPEAPVGLKVIPGPCPVDKDSFSVVVENESPLPLTVSEQDFIAVGVEEGGVPTLAACREVLQHQKDFVRAVSGTQGDEELGDVVSLIQSPKPDQEIALVVHRQPRLLCCSVEELSQGVEGRSFSGRQPLMRVTTLSFLDGDIDYRVEEGPALEGWNAQKPWRGQTAFTFAAKPNSALPEKLDAQPDELRLVGTSGAPERSFI